MTVALRSKRGGEASATWNDVFGQKMSKCSFIFDR